MADPLKPLFRVIAETVNCQLKQILEGEGRRAPTYVFGKVAITQNDPAQRLSWTHVGGIFVATASLVTGLIDDGTTPPQIPSFFRQATAQVEFFGPDNETTEHTLDRFVLATRQTVYQGNFLWSKAQYHYRSEVVDENAKNGLSVIHLLVPVTLPIANQADNDGQLVTIQDVQLRAGDEDVIDTATLGQPQFVASEWT
jgi:hypothetical protein